MKGSMFDSPFPSEVPGISDAIRIKPIDAEPLQRFYRSFCQETFVAGRFWAIDYCGRQYLEVHLSSGRISVIHFNLEHKTWFVHFDDQRIQLEVEKILE